VQRDPDPLFAPSIMKADSGFIAMKPAIPGMAKL